jgi:hypothetical protein
MCGRVLFSRSVGGRALFSRPVGGRALFSRPVCHRIGGDLAEQQRDSEAEETGTDEEE